MKYYNTYWIDACPTAKNTYSLKSYWSHSDWQFVTTKNEDFILLNFRQWNSKNVKEFVSFRNDWLYQCIEIKYLFPCLSSYLLVFSLILVVLISRSKMIIQSSPALQELNLELEDPTHCSRRLPWKITKQTKLRWCLAEVQITKTKTAYSPRQST